MRTTVEITELQRRGLSALAGQRGLRGFSLLVQEALDCYLESQQGEELQCLLDLQGSLTDEEAAEVRHRIDKATLPFDLPAALLAGEVSARLQATGQGIGLADTLQAGVCKRHDLPLATRNRRHFERVDGLRLAPLDE